MGRANNKKVISISSLRLYKINMNLVEISLPFNEVEGMLKETVE